MASPGWRLAIAGVICLFLSIAGKEATAQDASSTRLTSTLTAMSDTTKQQAQVVKGVVTSAEDNQPLPGANIYLKGTTIGVAADEKGFFEFPQQLKIGDILVFSYVGCESQEYVIADNAPAMISMPLPYFSGLLGEVSMDEPYKEQSSFATKLVQKIKSVF